MKDFLRALRFALPYRWRFTASVVCALLAAFCWSINFTAIYPVLKIFGSDQNLQEWVNSAIDKVNTEQIQPLEAAYAVHKDQLKNNEKELNRPERERRDRQLTGDIAKLESKLDSSRHELY